MVPVPLTVEPIMKNTSNICLVRLVRVKAYITSRTGFGSIYLLQEFNELPFSETVFCPNPIRVSVWDPFCNRRGKENQLMSEVRTVEGNMIPHRDQW